MSKRYARAHTPPSPPPISGYKPSSSHSSKSYVSSKSDIYSSKDYNGKSLSSKYDKSDNKYSHYDKYSKYENYDDKFEKYDKVDKIDKHSHYEKSDRSSRYDKYEKSEYKNSYSSSKSYGDSLYSSKKAKTDKYEREDRGISPYKSKSSNPSSSALYSDRNSYALKYPSRNSDDYTLKYPSEDLQSISDDKYSSRSSVTHYLENGKKYDSYSSKSSTYPKSYRTIDDPYYDTHGSDYNSYTSYKTKSDSSNKLRDDRDYNGSSVKSSNKSYSRDEYSSSNTDSYQRYVIGDSVVYGSPGHNPEDLYPGSPKLKRKSSASHTSISPKRSSSKSYSRYSPTSPKYFKGDKVSSSSVRSSYTGHSKSPHRTSESSFRRPLSPLPRRSFSPQSGYSTIKMGKRELDRDYLTDSRSSDSRSKGLISRARERAYNNGTGRPNRRPMARGVDQEFRGGNLRRGPSGPRGRYPSSNNTGGGGGGGGGLLPRPSSPPKPLLSIPLTESSLPKRSRDRYSETISHEDNVRPTMPFRDKGGLLRRRIEGRMRQSNLAGRSLLGQHRRPISPRDKRRRRPDDLRLWIESRKTVSRKRNGSPTGRSRSMLSKPSSGGKEVPASLRMRALLESKKRMLIKSRARTSLPTKRLPLKRTRRPESSRKSRERESLHSEKKRDSSQKDGRKESTKTKISSSREGSYKKESLSKERSSRDRKVGGTSEGSRRTKLASASSDAKSTARSKLKSSSLSSSRKGIRKSSKVSSSTAIKFINRKSSKTSSSSIKSESSRSVRRPKGSTSKDGNTNTKRSPKKESSPIKDDGYDLFYVEDQV